MGFSQHMIYLWSMSAQTSPLQFYQHNVSASEIQKGKLYFIYSDFENRYSHHIKWEFMPFNLTSSTCYFSLILKYSSRRICHSVSFEDPLSRKSLYTRNNKDNSNILTFFSESAILKEIRKEAVYNRLNFFSSWV